MQGYFDRITPLVGASLRSQRVAVVGLPAARPVVELLAACGVRYWSGLDQATVRALDAHHGAALGLAAHAGLDPRCDLLLGVGPSAVLAHALRLGRELGCPTLLVSPPGASCAAWAWFPGDAAQGADAWLAALEPAPIEPERWATAAHLAAAYARAILLRDSAYGDEAYAAHWRSGARAYAWEPRVSLVTQAPLDQAQFTPPLRRRGPVLVAGLGSLGSLAAVALAPHTTRLVLADPDSVDVANPVRQAFAHSAIGELKARALADDLSSPELECQPCPWPLDGPATAALIKAQPFAAALVVTGTGADYAIARELRRAGIPHVVGRCYPRARFWEAMLIDGAKGPDFDALRGHLHRGPAAPPTPEQRAAYSDAGALEAEPATRIESGWAAAWMARLVAALLQPEGLRPRWLLELLDANTPCLLGGISPVQGDGGPAYGISAPGMVRALGPAAISRPAVARPLPAMPILATVAAATWMEEPTHGPSD